MFSLFYLVQVQGCEGWDARDVLASLVFQEEAAVKRDWGETIHLTLTMHLDLSFAPWLGGHDDPP